MDQLQLRVNRVRPENKDAATIVLQRSDGQPLLYEAGQFLTLLFFRNGQEMRRSYSLSSTPGIDDFASITIKRIPNGEVSRWLLDSVQTGDQFISLRPAGRFTVTTHSNASRQFFFIAAGSGIVPVYSLIKKILVEEPLSEIILINQNRSETDILFDLPIKLLQATWPSRFVCINLLSQPEESYILPQRLNNFLLDRLVRYNVQIGRKQSFYLCGPASFMRMAQFTLRLIGFAEDQIKKEIFTVGYIPPPPLITDYRTHEIVIHINRHDYKIQSTNQLNVLQAAINNGIQLPYSCRSGRCSSCVAKLLRGKLIMSTNEVLTEKDLQEGWILTCVGYALTDIELGF
jgi:ring-1,2-phenylacetyl-CoA epoxidase subunit PaaE